MIQSDCNDEVKELSRVLGSTVEIPLATAMEKTDWELKKLEYQARVMMATPEMKVTVLSMNKKHDLMLFERTPHLFRLSLHEWKGPIVFKCWKQPNKFVEFKAYLSLFDAKPVVRKPGALATQQAAKNATN